jgi:glycosyltransferase involved in cell wall biosynthesis
MDSGPGGERKGRDLLPEIVRGIKSKYNDEVTFLIFGAGSDEWKNKNYSHVYSAGRVQGNENLNFLYNASDLFVFPTKAENLANVALESMACGTPVATFRSGGMMDLIMDGQNGILANPLGTQQIIKLINLLLSDKNQLIQFAHSSRQKILDHFTKEKEASKILDIYNSVLSQTSKR